MTHEEFQKYYEEDGDKIFAELSKLSEAELLKLIANKNEGRYQIWKGKDNYQVWTALQSKGTSKSIKPLFNIVSGLKNEYLIRYHACNALFAIAGIKDDDFKGKIQYGLDKNRQPVNRQNAIDKLEHLLNKFSDL